MHPAYSVVYLALVVLNFGYFLCVQNRWRKLIALASLSSKITVLLLLFALLERDLFALEVFFFYSIFGVAEIIFIAYILARRDLA